MIAPSPFSKQEKIPLEFHTQGGFFSNREITLLAQTEIILFEAEPPALAGVQGDLFREGKKAQRRRSP